MTRNPQGFFSPFFQVSQSESIIDMNSALKESLIVFAVIGGFVPLVFAIVCMPKYPEAAWYWFRFAIMSSIAFPTVGFVIDRAWRKLTKND